MIRKKILNMVLISSLLMTIVPSTGYTSADAASVDIVAAEEVAVANDATTSQEATQTDLERIIKAVKSKITVPSNLSQFDYSYSTDSYSTTAVWNLNWRNEDSSKSINVQSDQNGNIIFYYFNNDEESYAPKYLKSELAATAKKFLKKVAPDICDHLKYVSAESQGFYNGQYTYQFQRMENGIPMMNNTVSVGVSFKTGKVISYSSDWQYDVKVPSAEVTITAKEAAKIIGNKVTMKLSYQNAYATDKNGNTSIKAFLVYAPDETYVAVDAKTGEVYTTQDEWIEKNGYGMATASKAEMANEDRGVNLTDEELSKVEDLAGLISKEDAIKAVTDNKNLLLDSDIKSISANLYKQDYYYSSSKSTNYVWNITLSDPREVDYSSNDTYRAYAYATVDAKTGKLISYYASVKDSNYLNGESTNTANVKYTSKQGQKIFEDFVNTQIPDIFKKTVLAYTDESYILSYKDDEKIYGGYYYQYERVNEGINYSYNGIYGAVDAVTGKIYSYSYTWNDDVTFESPKNIITASQAFDSYITKDGFKLAYEINTINTVVNAADSNDKVSINTDSYSVDKEVRLVYRTDISPVYISPFTGKQLNYDGEEYNKNDSTYTYSDIKNHKYSRSILLLADMGIGFTGGKFLPDQAITNKELYDFLSLAEYYYYTGNVKLKKDDSTITRLEASKLMIQILGYENIAKIKGIFNVDFKDKNTITEANLGYVSLAKGLGLITCNSKNEFKPNQKLTRAEAANMVIKMLSVQK